MALDTLRANKLRSSLTILGVVIGITAIVGMTSLVRGFDESLRESIRELGPNTIFLSKISIMSIAGGTTYKALFAPTGIDPVNKKIRLGAVQYTVVGVFVPSASLSGFDTGQDDFVVIPYTTHQ